MQFFFLFSCYIDSSFIFQEVGLECEVAGMRGIKKDNWLIVYPLERASLTIIAYKLGGGSITLSAIWTLWCLKTIPVAEIFLIHE